MTASKIIEFAIAPLPEPPETVTFLRDFELPGMGGTHRPGTFEIRRSREALDLTWPAWKITTTILLVDGGRLEALEVKADDLAAALARDVAI